MKKFKLKKWYPSLPPGLKTGMIVEFDGINSIRWEIRDEYEFTDYNCGFNGLELKCTEYWESIEEEEPLFITDDGVQVTDGYMGMILVCRDFSKSFRYAKDCRVDTVEASTKIFAHESNADEYIWRNKPVFSYKDVQNYGVHPVNMIRVEQLAKERSKE